MKTDTATTPSSQPIVEPKVSAASVRAAAELARQAADRARQAAPRNKKSKASATTNFDGTPRQRTYRSAPPLPPPPAGVPLMTRVEAAAFLGMEFGTFAKWEVDGRVPIQRYRAQKGTGRTMYYAVADLERLAEELRKLTEPYPDPEQPGVYRVPAGKHKAIYEATIDAQDLPRVLGKHWGWRREGDTGAVQICLCIDGQLSTPLERVIMGVDTPEGKDRVVHCRDGNRLNCRRDNLVIRSWSEQGWSKEKIAPRGGGVPVSRYKGVAWDSTRRLWRLQVGAKSGHRTLDRFRDEAEAAAAYDAVARELGGDAATLNFPDGKVPAPTYLGPDGQPVREKKNYRVPRGLPTPPPGVAMLTRQEAAAVLGISVGTLGTWENAGEVRVQRYKDRDTTGTPILYAAADIAALRAQLDAIGQPYPDPHPARAGVWRVPLSTLSGFVEALIDEADLPIVQGKRWNYVKHAGNASKGGAVILLGSGDEHRMLLKRLIMGVQDADAATQISHINGNPLDCRRANLAVHGSEKHVRACYKKLSRAGRPTTSRFKGVYWNERHGAWIAQIRIGDVNKRLGQFDDEEDAAFAYDAAAREAWGEEARVNFPRPGERPSAAAPCAPADLSPQSKASAARPPGKPTDFATVLHPDGSVTISWRSSNAAASAGVTFAILRRLPGQSEPVRIGTAEGTTSEVRRPSFTDTTVPAEALAAEGPGAQYIVQPIRATVPAEASDVLVVKLGSEMPLPLPPSLALAQAA